MLKKEGQGEQADGREVDAPVRDSVSYFRSSEDMPTGRILVVILVCSFLVFQFSYDFYCLVFELPF